MSYLAGDIAKYRNDPVAFAIDFKITIAPLPAYQEAIMRKLYAFSVPGRRIGGGLPQTGPWGRRSRGWRRHVRRMKAEKRHAH